MQVITPISIPTPFLVSPVNVYLYRGEALTLIDTGPKTDEALAALEAGLAAEGCAIEDLERIILTHHHIDHSGLIHVLAERSGAETCAHPDVVIQSRLGDGEDGDQSRKRYYYALMAELGVPGDEAERAMLLWDAYKHMIDHFEIDRTLPDGGVIDGFEVYHVPGHSSTDTLFLHRRHGFSIAGDHILPSINPNPLLRRPNPGQKRGRALAEHRASLRRSRALPLGLCYPGHGEPMSNPVEVIDRLLAQQDRRSAQILELIPDGGLSPYELARALYPELEMPHLYLGLSVATGQLEVLTEEARVIEECRDGVLHYRKAS